MKKVWNAPQSLIVAALFAMAIVQAARPATLLDPDMWWRLRTGEWMVRNGQIPYVDPFSTYGGSHPWVAYTWLFDLLLYGFYAAGGLAGAIVLVCLLWMVFAYTLFDLARSLSVSPWRTIAITGLCLIAIRGFATPRPWLFSMIFLTLELKVLFEAMRRGNWQGLWYLPPLFMLWANLHIQFVYGLLALGLVLVASKVPPKLGAAVASASLVATLLNPYGVGVYRVVLDYAGQGILAKVITELWHPDFRDWSTYLIMAMPAWAVWLIAYRRREGLGFWPLLIAAATLYFRMRRDAWFLTITATAIVLYHSASIENERRSARSYRRAAAVGSLAGFLLAAAYGDFRSERWEAILRQEYPVQAVEHVRRSGLTGPLLNTFDWGGYLMWRLPGIPVSIDGRTNVHPADRVLAFHRLWHGDLAAISVLDTTRLIIAPVRLPLTEKLREDQRFRLDYQDARAAVFVRIR